MKTGKQHLQSKTKLFERWASMHARCKKNWHRHKCYFDKGITVCNEWSSFVEFKKWALANGFDPLLQLDRRDNNKGYSPDNCRWITRIENNLNRSNTLFVDYEGETIALATLSEKLGWTKNTYRLVRYRISRKWPLKDALNIKMSFQGQKPIFKK